MKFILISIFTIHGLIHLLGFVKAFGFAQIDQLTQNISKNLGILWLLATLLFIAAAISFFFERDYWWVFGSVAVIISQILIILSWGDAKFGTVANIILLLPLIIGLSESLPTSYKNIYDKVVETELARFAIQARLTGNKINEILTEKEIQHLPVIIQKYLRYTGSVGKEKIYNFKAICSGGIEPKPDGDFSPFNSIQFNTFDEPLRIFYMKLKMYGLPMDGLHLYSGQNATMRIKIMSLFQVVDAKGKEMNQGETVTLFNDMCFFAPASLITKNITWETIDSLTVKAKFTNQNNTITANLYFNDKGELINFSSLDRFESADGIVYKSYEWLTPTKNYKDYNGRKIPSYGETIWRKPEGDLCYGKFNIESIEYNCK